MFNNHSLILEGLNGGHDNLVIYDEFRKDLFLETSFYYMYSVILLNFFILMVYLMVTCDKIKNISNVVLKVFICVRTDPEDLLVLNI